MLTPRKLVRSFVAHKAMSDLLARFLPALDRPLLERTNGRYSLASLFTGLPVFSLTTTGAKSGRPRTQPLLYLRDPADPRRLAVVASNWGKPRYPSWYHNLRANPRATAVVDGQTLEVEAEEVAGEAYQRLWEQAVAIYPGFKAYRRRANRRIPVFLLTPLEEQTN